ncbi:acyl-CoA thioesterase II [Actinospica durhamensis]|uniref:Acyl-CoA thioesterase 2 n=1 Tax=Actinospica durhamensis TaxID=1508375 RepID=A0A941ESK2_9ACTN|nr:acyl-CoA thioesterase II [Actinospica durhamensis]MBR7836755.1 acyl-CoA thioesterase II [Actinospica durhamensis]
MADERAQPEGAGLVGFLSLEELDRGLFRGWCHDGTPLRAFGGQVAGQALTAASRTVPASLAVHSLHGYFLRAGQTSHPMIYAVEDLRDGRTYATRRVTARQDGEAIFVLSASFKLAEPGGHDRQPTPPDSPDPGELPDYFELWASIDPQGAENAAIRQAVEVRYISAESTDGVEGVTQQKLWVRALDRLPDDPVLHTCALTYVSDLMLAPTTALAVEPIRAVRTMPATVFLTSLDHALWFHRPFRADEWLLIVQESRTAGDGRGLARSEVWTRDGRLVASAVQETVLRPLRAPRL